MIESYAEELDFPIPAELRQYVFAAIKGETATEIQTTLPVHPLGFPLLVFVSEDLPIVLINGKRQASSDRLMVNGQIDRGDIEMEINGKFGQVGLVLSPTATYYLFHKPGVHFSNQCRNFKTASPLDCKSLTNRLTQFEKPEEQLPILLEIIALLSKNRLPPIAWLDASVAAILSQNGKISQTELTESSGIGPRHFRRKFKEIIGITPKYFCKIIQLNTIFEHLKSSNAGELHRLALDCGYYDQSHFINDFNRLIGSSPGHFLGGEHAFVQTYLGRKDF